MVCPYCSSATEVINSRHQKRLNQVWRRRRCTACGSLITTHEMPDLGQSIRVRDTSGHLNPFSKTKLLLSLYDSCRHRPHPTEDAEALLQTVISHLMPKFKQGIVDTTTITDATVLILKRFDPAAATIYQAYHPLAQSKPRETK